MNNKLLRCCCIVLLITASYKGMAQTNNSAISQIALADSLASGNYKSVLTNFYQLALSKITGPTKAISFNSNPFAILLKNNPSLSIDTNYYKYRALRRLNIGFNLQFDSSFKFNGFSSTIKYALINRRDETVSSSFVKMSIQNDSEYTKLNHALVAYARERYKDDIEKKKTFVGAINSLFNDSIPFNKLDSSFQGIVRKLVADNRLTHIDNILSADAAVIFYKSEFNLFDSLRTIFQNKHLLTIGITDSTYTDGFFFRNLQFSAESVKGFLNPNHAANLEWDIKASYIANNDTLQTGRNLHRQIFSFEPGLNLVIKSLHTQKSFFEWKLSGMYSHIFKGIYPGEQENNLTFNNTISLRVYDDIWIPLQINYDPKDGNVFGFLNVVANFNGLKSLLQGKSN